MFSNFYIPAAANDNISDRLHRILDELELAMAEYDNGNMTF